MSTAETHLPTCYRHPDRETGLSCSECGRPICTECMTPAPVGLRCPDHAGSARRGGPRVGGRQLVVPRTPLRGTEALVTKALIAINVGIYLITAVQGAGLNAPGGSLWTKMILWGPFLKHNGDWWRLITAAFLHASVLHIAFNMLALWWIGAPVENYLGRTRYVGLYLVGGLAGSAGALVDSPTIPVVGASGAIFAILGAMLILEWQATGKLGGQAMTLIVINLALNFAFNGTGGNISIGGHVGGLIGGILATLAFARWGKGHAAYGKLGLAGIAGLAAVGVASIAIAYWRVRGLA
ncbi:MAG TPA: rhomboid family intramembrane serine protease [Gaiellaceae bacterium]|nr:rhomboid family intramembrane serine protease [Gaiellaceae bacterium]